MGAEAEGLAERVTHAGCVLVGADSGTAFGDYIAGSNHVLPTNGAARFASSLSPAALPAALRRGADRRRRGRAGPRRRAGGAGRGLRAPRPVDGGAHSRQWHAMTRAAEIDRKTAETESTSSWRSTAAGAGERATGVGFFDHMLDLLARHGRLDLDGPGPGRPADRRPPHRRGRRHLHRAGARPGARRPGRDHPLRPGDGADGRVAGRRARSTSPAAGCARSRRRCPPGAIGNFDHELTEEFFRALAANARLTLHVTVEAGTNAHHVIEAAFKAAGPGAAGRGRARPDRAGRARAPRGR